MLTSAIGAAGPVLPPLDRNVFPITRRWTYCNHAAVGPLPQPARDAMLAALDAQMNDGCVGILDVEARQEAVRADVARAIGAEPDEIAFMRSTSDGALLVANGLDWREGDEIILSDNEFGANAHPWLNLRDRGVSTLFVRAPAERLTVDALEKRVTNRTRVVTVSYVGYSDGYRHDLQALGAWCRRRGVIFAVDAIQGFGHLPLDVSKSFVDVCYYGVSKWLLSPQGLSVVYVRRDLAERLRPALCAWRSVREPMRLLDYGQALAAGARRFEGGTINYPALVAFRESLRLITDARLERIERHVLALNDRLIRGAQESHVLVVSDLEPAVRSGITVLAPGRRSADELSKRADAARLQVTIRDGVVRVAPHGYNTEEDIDRVLEVLR